MMDIFDFALGALFAFVFGLCVINISLASERGTYLQVTGAQQCEKVWGAVDD